MMYPSYGLEGEHITLYMGEGKNPTKEHLFQLGEKYRIKEYREIVNKVEEVISRWSSFAKEVGVSVKSYSEIGKILK